MTPQQRYEADRRPGVSPEWEQLAELTREAYAEGAPRYWNSCLQHGPTPSCVAPTKRANIACPRPVEAVT